MTWLKLIGSSVYGYIALAFTILLAFVGYQRKKLKRSERQLEQSERNLKVLINSRDIELAIDQLKAEKERDAQAAHLRAIKDLGEITNEINEISDADLINRVSGVLNSTNLRNNKNPAKVSD